VQGKDFSGFGKCIQNWHRDLLVYMCWFCRFQDQA